MLIFVVVLTILKLVNFFIKVPPFSYGEMFPLVAAAKMVAAAAGMGGNEKQTKFIKEIKDLNN